MTTRVASRLGLLIVAVVAVGWIASCSDNTGPVDRTIGVRLVTAPGDDGALVFKVLAAGQERIDTVLAACSRCRVFARRVSDVETRVVVTGTIVPGVLVRIGVSSPIPASYTAFAVEGASRTFQFRSATAYELSVER